ncbi:MAG TPA: glucosamine-6-phosphate synthase, partial [Acidimicrobiales bacterium]
MCGVIAVLRRHSTRPEPDGAALLAALDAALEALGRGFEGVAGAAAAAGDVDRALRGVPGTAALVGDQALASAIGERAARLDARIATLEATLDAGPLDLGGRPVEEVNAALVACKDAVWAVGRDRLRTAAAVGDLAGPGAGRGA